MERNGMDFHWRHGFASLQECMRHSMLLTHLSGLADGRDAERTFHYFVANRGSFSEC